VLRERQQYEVLQPYSPFEAVRVTPTTASLQFETALPILGETFAFPNRIPKCCRKAKHRLAKDELEALRAQGTLERYRIALDQQVLRPLEQRLCPVRCAILLPGIVPEPVEPLAAPMV
jgi:hypothetical protein